MTLLFVDGFDHYNTADITKKGWAIGFGSPAINTSVGRRSGGCLVLDSTEYVKYSVGDVGSTRFWVGFAFKFNNTYTGTRNLFRILNDTGGSIIYVYVKDLYDLSVYNSTLPGDMGDVEDVFQYGVWQTFQIGFEIGDSSNGYLWVKIDDTVCHNWTGDNKFTGSAVINQWRLYAPNNGGYYDDLWFCDENGSKNNGPLGNCRIDTLRPDAAGNYSQMTPSAGSNYQCVDDAQYSETDYVTGNADGEKDTYDVDAAPTSISDNHIHGLQISIGAKESGEIAKLADLVRVGSNDYLGTFQDLTDTSTFVLGIRETDPSDSNDWTKAKINATEFGQEVDISSTTTTTTSTTTTT